MFASVESFSCQGLDGVGTFNKSNEDILVFSENGYGAIDGTRLSADVGAELREPVSLTSFLQKELAGVLSCNESTARECLISANTSWRQFLDLNGVTTIRKDGPAATAALIKKANLTEYSWAQTGDCYLIEETFGGEFDIVSPADSRMTHNELQRLQLSHKLLSEGLTIRDVQCETSYVDLLRELFLTRNVDRSTLNGEVEFANLLNGGIRDVGNVCSLIMFTDGMVWPTSPYGGDVRLTAKEIIRLGIRSYHANLQKLFLDDECCRNFVRFKLMDDASAIVIKFFK